jgi:hypothetical protein
MASQEKGQISVDELDAKKNGSVEIIRQVDSKESLSAYFTILAAAFGLISDGCEYI